MGYKKLKKLVMSCVMLSMVTVNTMHAQVTQASESVNAVQDTLTADLQFLFNGRDEVSLPYNSFKDNRSVSAVSTIKGEELISYPGGNLMEALAGRIPGLVVNNETSVPGEESVFLSIRGVPASVYIDGIERDPVDLSAHEVDKIQVIKDFSGRAALGVSGAGPVIWITTKKGQGANGMSVTAQYGINTPTVMPKYLDAYNYALLHNEALENDGQSPAYDETALEAYKNNSDPLNYPNIDYQNEYVKDFSSYRNVNFTFTGGDENVNYFSMFDYTGSSGLEDVGRQITSDRFKLRGHADFPINDWVGMSINLTGSYHKRMFPNIESGASTYNMFSQVLSRYPSNAHVVSHEDRLIISDDYQTNLYNELVYGGHGETDIINSQNDANLFLDLNRFVSGLKFKGTVSFNILSHIGIGKGGTEALYRLSGGDLERVVEKEVDPTLGLGDDFQTMRTVGYAQLNYDRAFGKHALTMDGSFFGAVAATGAFQPEKFMDLALRANYAFDQRYVLQFDVANTGSMRLPEGKRFNIYPTVGAAWVASNESFLSNSGTVDYLKFYTSLGEMGVNDFSGIALFNPFYLDRTEWQLMGSRGFGVDGSTSSIPLTSVRQIGNQNIELPKRQYFNAGVQSSFAGDRLSIQLDYFNEKNTGLLSPRYNVSTALLGGFEFLPMQNYEENKIWGFDGLIQFSNNVGDFRYSVGANAMYRRGKYLTVDEAPALADYRKRAGTDMDLFWLYQAEGLFQDQDEINSRNVSQSWGSLRPGDIRYVDYNGDGVVDQKDIHTTGAHSPRVFYGLNLSMGYKGVNLYVQGTGVADGQVQLSSPMYFKINDTEQNYSELMLDRWTPENRDATYPRLTTSSENNIQNSTFWLEDAAYFKIKNVELSYSLPRKAGQDTQANKWKVFVRGKNLLTFSKLSDYNVDPANINAGISTYPLFRAVSVGFFGNF